MGKSHGNVKSKEAPEPTRNPQAMPHISLDSVKKPRDNPQELLLILLSHYGSMGLVYLPTFTIKINQM